VQPVESEAKVRNPMCGRAFAFWVLASDFLHQSYIVAVNSLRFTHYFVHSRRYPVHNTLVPSVVLRLCVLGSVGIDMAKYTSSGHRVSANHHI
jgi:hypothetical protein